MSQTVATTAWIAAALTLLFSGYLFYEYILDFNIGDEYTYSNYSSLTTEHYDLRMELDFDNKVIVGEQLLKMKSLSNFLMEATLDIKDLDILEVLYNGSPADYRISNTRPKIGQALRISIPFQFIGNEFEILVKYKTHPEASGVSWLDKTQTPGNKMAYLFTHCETINCRSIAPFQDTPMVKSTFTAHIVTPENMIVRATGNLTQEFDYTNFRSTKFESKIPIPSYLFGIVAGDLQESDIDAEGRIKVITERALMREAQSSLSVLEQALSTLEEYLTDYIWGDYKIVIQPPSFPHGGMENPLLNFASYTKIQGDASSVDDTIHEIAHSWAGNLVTPKNWNEVWLKEAMATFLERKVVHKIYGESAYKDKAMRGKLSMEDKIIEVGADSEYTRLIPDPNKVSDPDHILTAIQAEKGFELLALMEELVGEALFKDFLVEYFNTFEFQNVDSKQFEDLFVDFIYRAFDHQTALRIYEGVNFNQWLRGYGAPPEGVNFLTPEAERAINLAEEYIIAAGASTPSGWKDWQRFSVDLKYIFLKHFLDDISRLNKDLVDLIDGNNDLYYLTNPDLISLFMQIGIAGDYYEYPFRFPVEFVSIVGNYELIAPIYAQMVLKNEEGAQRVFYENENFYSPNIREDLKKIVGIL
ncbi:unnamed protein product [Moneuplotes crassus]|uniref:Uncharacterized protein n=1 Tax=Euplotes crassus TaxID=5936 RepID=A0AAD1UA95_EUPCR|nr:unnamed protein product [Moneuplotes crassus]